MKTTTTAKLPAFLASAIVNGDLSGFDTDDDAKLYEAALEYIGEGVVTDVGEAYFSHGCDLPGVQFAGDVADYTIMYEEETPTPPRPAVKSYGMEVIADSSGKWCGNGIRLATRDEAERYAQYKFATWTLVTDTRVIESTDPVNYTFGPEGLKAVKS